MNDAARCLEEALVVVRDIGNRQLEGGVLASVGDLFLAQSRLSEASEAIAKGEALLREVGDPLELAKLLCTRGAVEISGGDLASARRTLEQTKSLAASVQVQTTPLSSARRSPRSRSRWRPTKAILSKPPRRRSHRQPAYPSPFGPFKGSRRSHMQIVEQPMRDAAA